MTKRKESFVLAICSFLLLRNRLLLSFAQDQQELEQSYPKDSTEEQQLMICSLSVLSEFEEGRDIC